MTLPVLLYVLTLVFGGGITIYGYRQSRRHPYCESYAHALGWVIIMFATLLYVGLFIF